MRKNFGAKPWVYPQPVLMIGTYDENGTPNLMNAAWGGLELSINVQSKNTQNLKQPYRPYLLSASSTAEVRAG